MYALKNLCCFFHYIYGILFFLAFPVEQEPRRATPEKFTIPHMRASFGPNGQIVKILPNRPTDGQPATIEIHEVEAMLAENTESLELREFPGPLIRYSYDTPPPPVY